MKKKRMRIFFIERVRRSLPIRHTIIIRCVCRAVIITSTNSRNSIKQVATVCITHTKYSPSFFFWKTKKRSSLLMKKRNEGTRVSGNFISMRHFFSSTSYFIFSVIGDDVEGAIMSEGGRRGILRVQCFRQSNETDWLINFPGKCLLLFILVLISIEIDT